MKKTIFAFTLFVTFNLSAQNRGDKLLDFLTEASKVMANTPNQQPQTSKQVPQQRKEKPWFETKSTLNISMQSSFSNSSSVADYLKASPFLKDVESFVENTLTLDNPLNIIFVDNQNTQYNAHFNPSCNCIRISYSIIQQNADRIMKNFKGTLTYPDAIRGVTLQILFHEMGHYLVHNYNLNITGKEENAVDELSVMSMLVLIQQKSEYTTASICGILGWYEPETFVSSRSMVDVHAPSRERYYDMLSLYLGSLGNNALSTNFVGEKDYQISRSRFYSSPNEYKKAYNSWTELMARFL